MAGFGATLVGVADRLIETFGDSRTATLRRYTRVTDPEAGSTVEAVAEAIAAKVVVTEFRQLPGSLEPGDKQLIISASAFGAEPLTGRWTCQEAGGLELPIVAPIEAIKPGATVVYYQAAVRPGGARGSA